MNHASKAIAHEIKIRRLAYFYSAAERCSRGELWPSFAPALIVQRSGIVFPMTYSFPKSSPLQIGKGYGRAPYGLKFLVVGESHYRRPNHPEAETTITPVAFFSLNDEEPVCCRCQICAGQL